MDRIVQSKQTHWALENTPDALAAAIVDTTEAGAHDDSRELSARVAGRYSWEQVFTPLFDLYREVIHNYRRP
jgi:hypothetical protein